MSSLHIEVSCICQHGVLSWTSTAPRPCYAGAGKFLSRTVKNRIPQTCASPQVWMQHFFFSTVHGAEGELPRRGKRSPSGGFSFWCFKKKMGCILMGKAHLEVCSPAGAEKISPLASGVTKPHNSLFHLDTMTL